MSPTTDIPDPSLIDRIAARLKTSDTRARAVREILAYLPSGLKSEANRRWVELAENALRSLGIDYSTKDPLQIEYILSDTMIIKRMAASRTPFRKKRQRHRINPRRQVETTLVLTLALYFDGVLSPQDFLLNLDQLMAFVREVNHPPLSFKLYQILCLFYTQQGESSLRVGADFGHLAYYYFRNNDNALEAAITAHNLAITTVQMKRHVQTRHWLDIAHEYYKEHDYPRQLAAITALDESLGAD